MKEFTRVNNLLSVIFVEDRTFKVALYELIWNSIEHDKYIFFLLQNSSELMVEEEEEAVIIGWLRLWM